MSFLASRIAQELEEALIKARNKARRKQTNARLSSRVFWGMTILLSLIASRDIPAFFISSWGVRWMVIWTLPTAWYMMSSRWAKDAAADLDKIKITAVNRAYPGFCSHENLCSCRDEFFNTMEKHGINLYL